MSRKLLTTRTALITAVAMTTGSAIGTAADAIAVHLGYAAPGIGSATTAIATVWMLGKLDILIDDSK